MFDYYLHQMYAQIYVTRAEKCFYYCYYEKEGICIEVYLPPNFLSRWHPAARAFWKCVALNEPPALQESDYKDMSCEPEWHSYATEYRKLCEQIKTLEDMKESYRQEILKKCGDQSCTGHGIKVIKTILPGRIAYHEIPEIKDINIEKYRKNPTTSWRILTA